MRPRAVLLALGLAATLLLGSVLHVDAVIRNGYNCNPTACKLPSCLCASDSPPLPVADTPQFVTITFDDGISEFHNAEARQFLYASRNPNGCPIAATHFLSRQWTDFHTVNALYDQGHEIADHTVDHLGTPSLEQITVARDIYERWGRVPKKDIVGFRAPFLAYSLDTFRNLQTAGGFVYDSSMSTNGRNPHWPYTMDYGLADECFTGVCDNLDTRFPGLWEIPMYQLHYPADGSILGLMDPQFAGTEEILDMFKYNFRNHWQTSRAPFGIYLHTAWILNDPTNRLSILTRFFEWTQTEFPSNSVWWVSNQQLLSWLRSPVPISTLASSPPSYLSCGAAEVGPGMRLRTMQMDRDYSPCPKDRLQTCMFPDYSWKYCLAPGEKGCPSSQPSVVDPIPAGVTTGGNSSSPSSGGCAMPGDGCAFGRWQQASCACACAGSENATADASGRQGYCLDEGGRCTLEKVVDPRNNRFLSCAESAKARGDEHYFDGAKTTAASSTTATTASSTAAAPTSTGLPPPTSAPASSSSVPVAAIVAPIVILVALGGAGVAFFLLRRSRRSKVAKVGVEPPASGDTEKAVVMRTTDIERTASGLSPADMVRRSSSAL
ncbi:hypothetical protein DFJ74DRAFT_710532 [Hyaloraphidium curvatum]|nr:hypothetical protein DFJ74DRAFT_710532 [Hyaloraphidium curvatum]